MAPAQVFPTPAMSWCYRPCSGVPAQGLGWNDDVLDFRTGAWYPWHLFFWPRNQFCTLWILLQSLTTFVAVFCFNSFSFFACWIMLGLAEKILLLGCTDVYSDSWAFTDGLSCITITYTFLATPPELRSWSNPIQEHCTVYIRIYAYIYLYVCIYIYIYIHITCLYHFYDYETEDL